MSAGLLKTKDEKMAEFTSEPQKAFNPVTIIITVGLLAAFLGGAALYVHYHRAKPAAQKTVYVAGLLLPGNTDFEYYKSRVRIENVKATLGISFSNARMAAVSGILVNDGSRTLEAVQLHIILYDVWGKVSKERTAFALRPGSGFTGKAMEPLDKRGFAIGIESVEYYWDPKKISYEITGLKFK
jgi:hypothetical protein